jgi:hypothetical protein
MVIETDDDGRDDNEGPHCRNCHVGANNCYVCHSDDSRYSSTGRVNVSSAYTSTIGAVGNQANFAPQAFLRSSATVGGVGEPCLDGGFTFPHRTLGKDMLKDELWGVDYDGSVVAMGDSRTMNGFTGTEMDDMSGFVVGANGTQVPAFEYWTAEDRNSTSIIPAVQSDTGDLAAPAENIDSVCIDCHGDSTYWNGDDSAFYVSKAPKALADGVYGSGDTKGWELLLKGLP